MSEYPIKVHAADILTSASTACAPVKMPSSTQENTMSSPALGPLMSSSPLLADMTLNEDDSDVEMVTTILSQMEAAAITELVMPPKDTLPWVMGKKFYKVPPQPLVMTNEHQSKDWNTANTMTTGASGGSQKAFKSQQAAMQAFNEALENKAIAIVSE